LPMGHLREVTTRNGTEVLRKLVPTADSARRMPTTASVLRTFGSLQLRECRCRGSDSPERLPPIWRVRLMFALCVAITRPARIQQLAVVAAVPLRHVKTGKLCYHSSPPSLPTPGSSSRAALISPSNWQAFASKWLCSSGNGASHGIVIFAGPKTWHVLRLQVGVEDELHWGRASLQCWCD
jgi:hypothetical protein